MSVLFYNISVWLYQAGIRLVSPWNRKAALWLRGRRGLFARIRQSGVSGRKNTCWMHCASLGEFEQGRPLLEALRRQHPGICLVLTFFSPSGYEVRKNYEGVDFVFYLPADTAAHANRFLDLVHPDLVLWVKYEYWYHYLSGLKARGIPVLLVSGIFREGQPFFRWYGGLHRTMLRCFRTLFVQTDLSKELLAGIGFGENVFVTGDTRFDRVVELAEEFEPQPLVAAFCAGHRVIVAGSTWEEDEEQLDHYANTRGSLRFVVVPHEVGEERLKDMEKLFKRSVRLSVLAASPGGAPDPAVNVLIVDGVGLLARLYRYADLAYVGGGFGDEGVHNVLEAAVYGKPVIMGPVIESFAEAVGLVDVGGGFVIESALEAEKQFDLLLGDEKAYDRAARNARDFVKARTGATAKILAYLQENRLLTS